MEEHQRTVESGWQIHGPHHESAVRDLPANFVPLRLLLQPGGLCVQLNTPNMTFGRHSEMDVRVALPDVSRRHCRFFFADNQWHVRDLSSLNGVYVNGDRVSQTVLHMGDEVRMGGLTFRVSIPDPNSTQTYGIGPMPQKAILKSIVDVLPPPQVSTKAS